jgi:hypothetical protein
LHELEVVCHICGAPLCEDTQYCRHYRYISGLERRVIYCPAHAPVEQK